MAVKIAVFVFSVVLFTGPAFGEDKFFNSDGVKIRYVDEGAGEAILLLHGFSGNVERAWVDTGVLPDLVKDYRVIAFDSRGNGKSGKPHSPNAYGIEMVRDAVRLLDHLKIQKAHIVGYSFGGHIAAKLLATNPHRFLTATLGGSSGIRSWTADQAAQSDQEERELLAGCSSAGQRPAMAAICAASERSKEPVDTVALAGIVRGRSQLLVSSQQLAKLTVPTLAIVGSEDPIAPDVLALKNAMPKLRVVVIDGAVHSSGSPKGTPRQPEFLKSLRTFIQSSSAQMN